MMDVVIDGVTYTPGDTTKIGIGITTRNRNKIITQALDQHRAHLPTGAVLVVVDDASAKPVDGADYRFDQQAGVATAKNKAIELLMDAGVEHLFLFDDDCWPIVDNWWKPYVESPEPHLMYIFGDLKKPPLLKDIRKLPADDQHSAWSGPRGCMLYANRVVVETVGGMDPIFNPWGYEHGDWSNRIHHAGLTTWRYADVAGSEVLFHSMDEWAEADRTIPTPDRQRLASDHAKIHHRRRDDWYQAYVDYRQADDVIITHLLTGGTATSSERGYQPDTKLLADLAKSIRHGRLIVLHDQLRDPKLTTGNSRPVEFVQVPSPTINVFFARHQYTWQWLRDHPQVGRCWTVDGTDVTQLHDPFKSLESGKIHLGWEPKIVADQWMLDHHREPKVAAALKQYGPLQLLNAGLIGGDRTTVMDFLHGLFSYWYDVELAQAGHDVGDMGQLQRLAYSRYADRIVTGSRVATVFKAFEKNNQYSLWAHK